MIIKVELTSQFHDLQTRLEAVKQKLDTEKLSSELSEKEERTKDPQFWTDQVSAQQVMRAIGKLRRQLDELAEFSAQLDSIRQDLDSVTDTDQELLEVISADVSKLDEETQKLELKTFLSGKYDSADAVLSIHAGQGGTEANDWAQMLLRMYLRYAAEQGWETKIVHEVRGAETGLATVSVEVYGDYAYGYLKHEHGTHRLVRNSPFNSAGLRQTSFAGVEVTPLTDADIDIEIDPADIEFSAVRSSGPGGQNVNKVATSVRIVHKPSGIAVTSSSSRSQSANREAAMNMLKAKLYLLEEQKRDSEQAELKGEYKLAAWGNQIRNYVLQPYKLVKDLRTGVETSNTDSVLDGGLDEFIAAEIRQL